MHRSTIIVVLGFAFPFVDAFAPKKTVSWSPYQPTNRVLPNYGKDNSRFPSVCLADKAWDRIGLEEDPEPYWYLLNCVVGLERELLDQCRTLCEDMPDAHRFIVPIERKTRSHGANRMVTESKVKYPGYVFAKMRLCPEIYEALSGLDLMRTFMGTVHRKGFKKLPPIPAALSEEEVEKFGLEDEVDMDDDKENEVSLDGEGNVVIVDSEEAEATAEAKKAVREKDIEVYQGFKVEDMVKVTKKCQFFDEDGIVRRLKDGKIFVRFYTYGSMYEEWMQPEDLRKLSNLEILKGLSGANRPIMQRDLENSSESQGRRGEEGFRQVFNPNLGGTKPRNRRQDRTADRFSQRDSVGRADHDADKNWQWYKDQQRGTRTPDDFVDSDGQGFRAGSGNTVRNNDGRWVEGDPDSQWGRAPQRQERRGPERVNARLSKPAARGKDDDWSSYVSPVKSSPAASKLSKTESDSFFDSLVADLSDDLGSSSNRNYASNKVDKSSEDDFFASLMSDLADTPINNGGASRNYQPQRETQPKKPPVSSSDDDFFASLGKELDEMTVNGIDVEENLDDFFDSLVPVTPKKETKPAPASQSKDFTGMTVPELKELLKARGLKVSGKKSELIERLASGTS